MLSGASRAYHAAARFALPRQHDAFRITTMTPVTITTALGSPPAPPPRPAAARTRMLLEAPILSTLLRLAAPNVLNLLAIAGMITFDALFLGRLGADALAGVSLAFPFVMLIQHSANGGMAGGVPSTIGAARRRQAGAPRW